MSDHLHFLLPVTVASAINLGSAPRYPTAPKDASARMYFIEASRVAHERFYSVSCAAATAPLIIADIERVKAASTNRLFHTECDHAMKDIRAELTHPNP